MRAHMFTGLRARATPVCIITRSHSARESIAQCGAENHAGTGTGTGGWFRVEQIYVYIVYTCKIKAALRRRRWRRHMQSSLIRKWISFDSAEYRYLRAHTYHPHKMLHVAYYRRANKHTRAHIARTEARARSQ